MGRPRELAHCELLRYLGSRPSTLCCLLAFEFSNDVSNKPNLDFTLLENGSLDHASPIRGLPRSRLVVSKSWLSSMLTSALMTWSDYAVGRRVTKGKAPGRKVAENGNYVGEESSFTVRPSRPLLARSMSEMEQQYGSFWMFIKQYGSSRTCKGRNGSGGGRRVGPKSVNVNGRKAKSPQIVSDTLYSNF